MKKLISIFIMQLSLISVQSFANESNDLTDQQLAGKKVFEHWCTPCHGQGDKGHPGTAALTVLYKGNLPGELEDRTNLNNESIEHFVRKGITIMPPFRITEITEEDLAVLQQYLTRNNPQPKKDK